MIDQVLLESRARAAIKFFWQKRVDQAARQAKSGSVDRGARSAVTGGGQLDSFVLLFEELLLEVGVPREAIFRKKTVELPGFFRPSKKWDLLVVMRGQLLAALEAKSHIGPSFGNNFNNRTEEAMGSALDLWTAFRDGAFNKSVRPWLGYLIMLEDCSSSQLPLKVAEPHFKVFEEFRSASYAKRYELFMPTPTLHHDRITEMTEGIGSIGTRHRLVQGDAQDLSFMPDESVHLVVTSPPYWTLKRYEDSPKQLGHVADYEEFLACLRRVWEQCYRVLVPGGRLVCVVGDVCLSRRAFGRHLVVPLHADICVICRQIGFDNLNPIIWHKISNANYEVSNGTKFLGKPYEPNAIIKNDIEFILMQRKPGGYRQPTAEQRKLSMLSKDEFDDWFAQFWRITGASTKEHPAPFPLELASRLVRMFSFVGDTVLDPFLGSGTTMVAAMRANRNSIGVEIAPKYLKMARRRLLQEQTLFSETLLIEDQQKRVVHRNGAGVETVASGK